MPNPFVFFKPLEPADLVDREDELALLADRLKSCVNTRLSGPRDFGKTSLLRRMLLDAENSGMTSVYVDLDGIRTKTDLVARIDGAYSHLKGRPRRLYSALRRRGGSITVAGFGAQIGGDGHHDEVAIERAAQDLLNLPLAIYKAEQRQCAIVFDEFQSVFETKFDGLIRSVIQHHGNAACYVFAGSHPGMMSALFSDYKRPFYGQAAPLVLEPLPQLELGDYITERFAKTGRDVGEAVNWLLELVEGHPQRSMLLSYLLWSETAEGQTAGDDEWGRALIAVWHYLREPFRAQWASLEPIKRSVVEAVAFNHSGLNSSYNRQRFGLPRGSATTTAAQRLANEGMLNETKVTPTGYRLVDPLFARWLLAGREWPYLDDLS